MKQKVSCDTCNRKVSVKFLILFQGKYLCGQCRRRLPNSRLQQGAASFGKVRVSCEKALSRVYTIKGYKYKDKRGYGHVFASLSVPQILIGKKVKLVVVE